ncbi:hypothetical protein [Microcoleus sp. B4-D4]
MTDALRTVFVTQIDRTGSESKSPVISQESKIGDGGLIAPPQNG